MQSAKPSQTYKFQNYQVTIVPFSQKKIQISVVDTFQKIQFYEKLLTFNYISTTTLVKALQKATPQIKIGMKVNKSSDNAVLQIDVLVASMFLKPVEEVIYLKKLRDISQSELLKSSIALLSSKLKTIKQGQKDNSANVVICGQIQTQQKAYSGNGMQQIATIKLPKGKYLLTLSYLVKATSSWMYIYFQQSQQCIQNCGFYLPNNSNFFPITIRKSYTVNGNQENVSFSTNAAVSYPIRLRNVFITAQKLKE